MRIAASFFARGCGAGETLSAPRAQNENLQPEQSAARASWRRILAPTLTKKPNGLAAKRFFKLSTMSVDKHVESLRFAPLSGQRATFFSALFIF